MLSRTTEYALLAMVNLAGNYPHARTARQIAAETGIPAGYLCKIMQGLSRAAVVSGQRGLKGGFMLARSPSQINVLDIIAAVDPLKRITTCPLGNTAHCREICLVHRKMDEAIAAVERIFKGASLAELIKRPARKGAVSSR